MFVLISLFNVFSRSNINPGLATMVDVFIPKNGCAFPTFVWKMTSNLSEKVISEITSLNKISPLKINKRLKLEI